MSWRQHSARNAPSAPANLKQAKTCRGTNLGRFFFSFSVLENICILGNRQQLPAFSLLSCKNRRRKATYQDNETDDPDTRRRFWRRLHRGSSRKADDSGRA